MDLPFSPDGGYYGSAPTEGTPRWPWVAWLFARFGEPAQQASDPGAAEEDADLL